jgi:hypothetical protein
VAILTASKRQRVRPRKSLRDERILRDTTGEMITQCNRREVRLIPTAREPVPVVVHDGHGLRSAVASIASRRRAPGSR